MSNKHKSFRLNNDNYIDTGKILHFSFKFDEYDQIG